MSTRGNAMPTSFSWSFKRNFKEGCIWQDVSADDDLILPASEGEYILKGSKLVVASKGDQWLTPVLSREQDLATSPGLYANYNGISIIGNVRKMNTESTSGSPPSNEQDVNVGEESCSITFSDDSQKSDIIYDTEKIHIDPGKPTSSCVTMNNDPSMNLKLSIPHEMADDCHSVSENGEIGNPECKAALGVLQDQPPTLSGTLSLQAIQVASDTTCSDHIHAKLSELSTAEEQVGVTPKDVDVVSMPMNFWGTSTPVRYQMEVCNAPATARQQTSKCSKPESRLNFLHWASCKATDHTVMDSQGKSKDQNRSTNTVHDTQRRIKTMWVCSQTPVLCTHVEVTKLDGRSAYKPPIPSSTGSYNHRSQRITCGVSSNDKEINCKRVGYSDQLGVELPPTMAMNNIAGQKSAPVCASQQRLTPRKATGSAPAYGCKAANSHYLQKRTSLPVFGSEKRQQQPPLEELGTFGVESTTSKNNSVRALGHSHSDYKNQDSKFPLHVHNRRRFHGKSTAHHHDRADFSQDTAKVLWEELLQTTQQVFTNREIM